MLSAMLSSYLNAHRKAHSLDVLELAVLRVRCGTAKARARGNPSGRLPSAGPKRRFATRRLKRANQRGGVMGRTSAKDYGDAIGL